jgi:hypothetical protein
MSFRTRIPSAAATAAGLLAMSTPAAFASTPATTATSGAPGIAPPAFTFVPPHVGPLTVDIGPTIINGKVTDPGLHVSTPGTSIPTFTWPPSNGGQKAADPRGTRVRMNGGG